MRIAQPSHWTLWIPCAAPVKALMMEVALFLCLLQRHAFTNWRICTKTPTIGLVMNHGEHGTHIAEAIAKIKRGALRSKQPMQQRWLPQPNLMLPSLQPNASMKQPGTTVINLLARIPGANSTHGATVRHVSMKPASKSTKTITSATIMGNAKALSVAEARPQVASAHLTQRHATPTTPTTTCQAMTVLRLGWSLTLSAPAKTPLLLRRQLVWISTMTITSLNNYSWPRQRGKRATIQTLLRLASA